MATVTLSAAAIKTALNGYLQEDTTVHALTDHINREAEFFGKVRRSGKEIRGKYALIPMILKGSRNAVGARAELTTLPAPSFQKSPVDGGGGRIAGQIGVFYNTARIAFTETAIQASASSEAAFASVLEVEMRGITKDLGNDINRQCVAGDGSGKLCRIQVATSTTAISVDDPGGVACYPDAVDNYGARYLEVGDVVAVYSAAGTYRGASTIATIDYNATPNALTLTTALAGMTVGDFLFKASIADGGAAAEENARNAEIEGLVKWIDSVATAANVDPTIAGNERFGSTELDFTTAPIALSEALLHQTMSLVRQRAGKNAARGIAHWTTPALENDYATRVLMGDRRYMNTTEFAGGYTALTFAGSPIMTDKDWLPGHWGMLSMSDLYFYNQGGFYWFDRDAVFDRISNQMGWEATLLIFGNIGTPRRNVHAMIRGLLQPYRVETFGT